MRRLTTGTPSEKCVDRRFRRCANVTECTYTNLDGITYYTPTLYGIAYAPRLQTCTARYCTEYCRQLYHNGKYYNILLLIKRYNLYKVLVCSTTFFHLSLSCATFFQLRIIILHFNIIILYYNLMGPQSYMRPVVDRNVVMRRKTVIAVCIYIVDVNKITFTCAK